MARGSLSHYAQNVLEKKKSMKRDIPSKITFLKTDSDLKFPLNSEKSKLLTPKPPSSPKVNDSDQTKNMV